MKKRILIPIINYLIFAYLLSSIIYTLIWGISSHRTFISSIYWAEYGKNYFLSQEFLKIVLLLIFSVLGIINLIFFLLKKQFWKYLILGLFFYGLLCISIWGIFYSIWLTDLVITISTIITFCVINIPVFIKIIMEKNDYKDKI